MGDGRCGVCGRNCAELEPAFHRPDAVFAVPEEERDARVKQSDDLVSIDEEAFFIRCVVPVPVAGREWPYSWGFWAKVSREHFDDYRRWFSVDPPRDHPGFRATLANQSSLMPPTLGMPVHVHLGRGRSRPRLMLLGEDHPLTRQQERGITDVEVHAWSERSAGRASADGSGVEDHRQRRLDSPRPIFTPSLDEDGWVVLEPSEIGKAVERLDAPPRPRDFVKVPFRFVAADAHGDATTRVEMMWVLIDEVRADGRWSGTLDNDPVVPGPIASGTRVWLGPANVLAHERAGAPG